MSIRTIIPLLLLAAYSVQADPECAETIQKHQQLMAIYRNVPELQSLPRGSAFTPCDCREIAPGYYLVYSDIGSGLFVYHFALVKHHPVDDSWKLVDKNTISSSTPIQYIHHEVKENQYQIEILFSSDKWVKVFTGALPTTMNHHNHAERDRFS